jgi:inosine-uridine nucleoside N-ribohydrolase
VGCGSVWPMDGYASYPRVWRENAANMMGEIASAPDADTNAIDGPALLAKLLSESAEPVQILATGGLTNIATVLKTNPRLRDKIRSVVSMGGAIRAGGNLRVHGFTDHHSNTEAEWNYYIDPVAARAVFESGVPVRLVPIDATNGVPLTRDFLARTEQLRGSALGAFVQRTFGRISASTSNGEYFHWDPLAAAISVNPGLCNRVERLTLDVIADEGRDLGLPNGQPAGLFPLANFEGQTRKPLREDAAGATVVSPQGNPVDVCMHADAAAFENDFLATIGSN